MSKDPNLAVEINRLLIELAQAKDQLKTLRSTLKDVLTQNDDYLKMEEEAKQLSAKKGEMKKLLLADTDYVRLSNEIEEQSFKLKDLNDILSQYLIHYYNETQQTQITDNQGDTRQLIISAKIGQPETRVSES